MSGIKQDVKASVKAFVQMLVSVVVREATKKMVKNLKESQKKKLEDKIKDMSDDQLKNYFETNHYFKHALEKIVKAIIKIQSAEKTLGLMGKLQSIFEGTSFLKSPVSALAWPAPKVIISILASTAIVATVAVPLAAVIASDASRFPAANFSSNITSGYAPLSVQFTDLSKNATAWEWEFGDGHYSKLQNPEHTYVSEGKYSVKLTAKNENGTNSKSDRITVLEYKLPPVAGFSSSVSQGYAPLSVQFTDASKDVTGWNWDFGDGTNSTEKNPFHIYSKAGSYTVKLTAANTLSVDSTFTTITVLEQPILPVANFNSNVNVGNAPLTVQFTDLSENEAGWNWNFGDGYSSTEQNPIHTYSLVGNYIVNLTASNANGTDSKSATIRVVERQDTNNEQYMRPLANFASNVTEGPLPLTVQFTDLSESTSEWNWNFGDGYQSIERDPIHTFSTAGNYTVTLTAINANGTDSKLVTINVAKATPVIYFDNPVSMFYGATFSSSQLNASSSVPGTFVYTPSPETLSAGIHILHVNFVPDDAANYVTASENVTINIRQANPVIEWSSPDEISYGTPFNETQLDATATSINGDQLNGIFDYTLADKIQASGAVLKAGTHTLYVDFIPRDVLNYSTASKNITINVAKAVPEINWSNPADIIYGTALNNTQLNALPSVKGNFAYTPIAETVLGAGTKALGVTFIPDDAANYTDASKQVRINITKAIPEIYWNNYTDIIYGTGLNSTLLNASASVSGVLNYNPAPGIILSVGNQNLHVDFMPDDAANYTTASKNITVNISKAIPVIFWSKPEDIIYGTALNNTQLNALLSVNGTFVYTPAAGAVLSPGIQTLNAYFTPNDTVNYMTASKNVSIKVKAIPEITWSNPADIIYGTALNGTQLNALASVNGTLIYTPPIGNVLSTGRQTLHVDFIPDDAANYTDASKDVTLDILNATFAYIANSNSNNISVIDATNRIVASVPVGNYPWGIALSRDGRKAYVTIHHDNNVSVIDTTTHTVTATIPVGTMPWGVAASLDGKRVYVTNFNGGSPGTVSVIDTTINEVIATVPVGLGTDGVAVRPDGKNAYVANFWSNNVSVINSTTNTVIASVPVGGGPYGVAVNPAGTKTYVANYLSNNVSVINTENNTVIASVPVGTSPKGVAVNPAGTQVYVTIEGENKVSIIDTVTNAVMANVNVGNLPHGVSVSPDGTKVYVTNSNSSDVSVIDTATNTVIASVPVGSNPNSYGQFVGVVPVNPELRANFSSNVTKGYIPLTVQFTDQSDNATSWNWNFGDGNTSTEQNPMHTYSAVGNYIVNLTATNANGTDSKFTLIKVQRAIPTIIWNSPADVVYGTSLNSTQLNASVSVPGTFIYTPAAGSILSVGSQILHVDFTPDDSAKFVNASKDVTLNITKAIPEITWNNPADISYGTTLKSIQLNASASVPGLFSYNPTAGTILSVGTQTLRVDFAPDDAINYTIVSKNVTVNVTKATPEINWNNPADIIYGTVLNSTQLSASTYVNGTFVYIPSTGTVLGAGNQTLHVDFIPDDTVNYTTASKNVAINVTKAIPEINWSTPNIIYGTPLSSSQLKASALINGTFVYTPIAGTILSAGKHMLHVDFTPDDTTSYTTASKDVTIDVLNSTYAYITNLGSNTVSVIDTATNNVIDTINVGANPLGVVVDPNGKKAYVTNADWSDVSAIDTVSVIDIATNTVTATVNVGKYPYGIAVNPAGTKMYIVNDGERSVSVIDIATNTVIANVDVGFTPHGVVFTPNGEKAYVTNYFDSTVSVINTLTNTITATVPVDGYALGVAVTPDGKKVYVANYGGNISIIDTVTDIVEITVKVGSNPNGVAVTPDGKKVYITDQADSAVYVIDTATNSVTARVTVGDDPFGVSVTADGDKVYVANSGDDTVSIIDTETNNVTATIHVGNSPEALGQFIVPLTRPTALPVANFSSNINSGYPPLSIQFVDLSHNATDWNWDFGDGNSSTEQNPMHTFSSAGDYIVNLTVGNENGIDSKTARITVVNWNQFAYITNQYDNTVSVINTVTNTVTATIPVGNTPLGIAINPAGTRVFVTNADSG